MVRTRLLPFAILAVPAVAYFAFIHRYGVNTVAVDQWRDVELVGRAHAGHLSFGALWAQHNENRILFPNLLVLCLAYTTNLNVHSEEYLSAAFLVAAVALVIRMHRRRSPETPLHWYLPVAVLMLTWSQFENTLWGFQIAWYLIMICLVGALAILDRESVSAFALAVSIAIAAIGSFSSLHGLFIWMAGLVLLVYRRRGWRFVTAWSVAAIATTTVYFYHLNLNRSAVGANGIDPLSHPWFLLKEFVFSLGEIAGSPMPLNVFVTPTASNMTLGYANPLIITLGVVILATAMVALWRTGVVQAQDGPSPVGVALIVFALAFDAAIVVGRGVYGYAGVSFSRYTTFNVLVLVGAYLVVIGRPSSAKQGSVTRVSSSYTQSPPMHVGTFQTTRRLAALTFPVVVIACVSILAVFGTINGLSGARKVHEVDTEYARLLRHYPADREKIVSVVLFGDAQLFYLVQIAHDDKLSTFASR